MDASAPILQNADLASLLALAAALGWASGVRLYLVLFLTGGLAYLGWLPFALPAGLQLLAHPATLAASFALLVVEFLADKVPGIDSAWDALQAFIRVPAGAALAGAVFGADNATMATVSALLGGSLAATALATKASVRLAANTSPEPFSNWGLSLLEDGLVLFIFWLALEHPIAFACTMVVLLLLSIWLLHLCWRFLRLFVQRWRGFWQRKAEDGSALT